MSDPLFREPYVDREEWRDKPARHRFVHGGFKGTSIRFSFYFPPQEQYEGRFFQHVMPFPINEYASAGGSGEESRVGFALASGGYFVETNGGGMAMSGMPGKTVDPTLAGYRINAACAQYSRVVATQMYGSHRTYGYLYGGSGGGFKTISGLENSSAWDGAVPYVIGNPMAIPNAMTVRLYAMRVLKDKFPQIVDAIEPGGSGDMYAGLNEEEREALREVTRMGFPPRNWYRHKAMDLGPFAILFGSVVAQDPSYFTDFWTKPGYEGANPPPSLKRARIQQRMTIRKVITADEASKLGLPAPAWTAAAGVGTDAWRLLQQMGTLPDRPVAFEVDEPPTGYLMGALINVVTGGAAGSALSFGRVHHKLIMVDIPPIGGIPATAPAIKAGDDILVDNSNFLAVQTYHRHQVPTKDYYVWNQFRGPDGLPIYPQRPKLLAPGFAASGAGSLQTGRFAGKMILVQNLMDEDAHPWMADWYRNLVKAAMGRRAGEHFRLWYTDYANHGDFSRQEDPTRTISYIGVLQQALRDVSAWVERGTRPPDNTAYQVVDGQVVTPARAAQRRGIQPTVALTANGGVKATVKVGEAVAFAATVDVPSGAGKVVSAEWDFEGGIPAFPVAAQFAPAARLTLKANHAFQRPGTYFPALRVAAQREGDAKTAFARIRSLGRVRVVVT
jgi:hypothetical protein